MIKSNVTLSQAIAQFDRSPTNPVAEGYRSQRAEILKRFPRDKWPEMRLDDYALGQPAVEDTYCRWLEYKSHWMGSIRGGSAKKLIIYKRKEREGWYFPKAFSNEREAWDRLRSEFSQGQTRILGVSIVIALAIASLFTNFFSSQSVPWYATAVAFAFWAQRLVYCGAATLLRAFILRNQRALEFTREHIVVKEATGVEG